MTRADLMRRIERAETLDELKALVTETRKKVQASKRAANKRKSGRPPRAAGTDKAAKRETKAEADRAEYEAVVERDRACTVGPAFGPCSGLLTIDHQWGRGKAPTKKENCRRLCERHHRMKTDSNPTRAAWLRDFEGWAEGHGYKAEADKAFAVRVLEEAQHPARGEGETTP